MYLRQKRYRLLSEERMLGLTTRMYAIVMKVVKPAISSVLKVVLFSFNLKHFSIKSKRNPPFIMIKYQLPHYICFFLNFQLFFPCVSTKNFYPSHKIFLSVFRKNTQIARCFLLSIFFCYGKIEKRNDSKQTVGTAGGFLILFLS